MIVLFFPFGITFPTPGGAAGEVRRGEIVVVVVFAVVFFPFFAPFPCVGGIPYEKTFSLSIYPKPPPPLWPPPLPFPPPAPAATGCTGVVLAPPPPPAPFPFDTFPVLAKVLLVVGFLAGVVLEKFTLSHLMQLARYL